MVSARRAEARQAWGTRPCGWTEQRLVTLAVARGVFAARGAGPRGARAGVVGPDPAPWACALGRAGARGGVGGPASLPRLRAGEVPPLPGAVRRDPRLKRHSKRSTLAAPLERQRSSGRSRKRGEGPPVRSGVDPGGKAVDWMTESASRRASTHVARCCGCGAAVLGLQGAPRRAGLLAGPARLGRRTRRILERKAVELVKFERERRTPGPAEGARDLAAERLRGHHVARGRTDAGRTGVRSGPTARPGGVPRSPARRVQVGAGVPWGSSPGRRHGLRGTAGRREVARAGPGGAVARWRGGEEREDSERRGDKDVGSQPRESRSRTWCAESSRG